MRKAALENKEGESEYNSIVAELLNVATLYLLEIHNMLVQTRQVSAIVRIHHPDLVGSWLIVLFTKKFRCELVVLCLSPFS